MELQGEFRKIKPPSFYEEADEVAEAWVINMNKYFWVYKYKNNLKASLSIYQIQGNATLWWEEVKSIQGIKE